MTMQEDDKTKRVARLVARRTRAQRRSKVFAARFLHRRSQIYGFDPIVRKRMENQNHCYTQNTNSIVSRRDREES
jgi:hypothetical protein